eukprot:COSAG01_NODE_417_length_17291_cov_610.598825_4_plen_49_part_00
MQSSRGACWQVYDAPATQACFKAWGGEARCLLRVLRGNFKVVHDAIQQ